MIQVIKVWRKKQKRSRKRKKNIGIVNPSIASSSVAAPVEKLDHPPVQWWVKQFLPWGLFFFAAFFYAFYPTIQWMASVWRSEPDYSHGILVLPLAALILYLRSDSFPGIRSRVSYGGLSLILLAIALRLGSRLIYADFLDGWAIVPMVAGASWFLLGRKATWWALPAIVFLILMVPLPYQAESLLSWKLQGVATGLSTVMLRVLGQPAVAEGHVIWLNGEQLFVEQACSGLRIFVGVIALAYFWAAISDRAWIDRIVLLAAAIPVAVVANSIRITSIGLLYSMFGDKISHSLIHDYTGLAMIPLAFMMLWLLKVYWEHLYRPLTQATGRERLEAI